MSERPLLLSSAKSGVLLSTHQTPSPWWRRGAIAFGILAVLVGGVDVVQRISRLSFGSDVMFTAFAPAAALQNPSILDSFAGQLVATSSVAFVPTRLRVAAIGIDAKVESVGKKTDGSMATPSTFYTVGWYSLGSRPGESGNTVIDGHVNNALGLSGVFEHLDTLNIGDEITVSGAHGESLTYLVTGTQEYDTNNAPLEVIFSKTGPNRLVLITCDGEWVSADHSYNKRLVVTARLAQ